MTYTEDKQPSGLSVLTDLANDDTVIVGDTSDVNEVVKTISWTNLKTAISTYVEGLASYFNVTTGTTDDITEGATNKFVSTANVDAAGAVMNTDTTTAAMSFVIDEDTMVSDLATKVPTQQSVKAYVDANAGSVSDTAYGVGWDAVTGVAPSKNAVYDKIETLQVKPAEGAFVDGDKTKLDGIETGADVTDTANVTAAGALMDSEVDADIKTLSLPANTTISAFGATLVDDADAATARTTLGVDAAGTDNSTDVTLAGTPDYITITGQTITRNQIDLTADVTGVLPEANLPDASTTAQGVVELATTAEVTTGTDTARAITPDALNGSSPTLADVQVTGHIYADAEVDDGNSSTADTIDWGTGNFHKSTMTGNCTYTFTAPDGPGRFQLKLVQDATGSRTATWPASVKWPGGTAPTLSTAANAIDIITFYYDGTNYFGVDSLNFS